MQTSSSSTSPGNLVLRCRSHRFLDIAAMASVLLLIAAFLAHAVNPAPAAARTASSNGMVAVADACTCPQPAAGL